MSDSATEQFILQYHVDTQETIKRLDELNKKIEQTTDKNKKQKEEASKHGKAISEFFNKAGKDADSFLPGLDKVAKGFGGIAKGAIVATVAIAGLVYVMKTMRQLQDDYEIRRVVGSNTGLSAQNVNQLQRQFTGANGRMTRADSYGLMGKVSELSSAAYTNPNSWNPEALKLRNAGVNNVFGSDGKIKDTNEVLDEMTKKFKSVSEEQAQAIGMSIGLTMDETKAIRERNMVITQGKQDSDEVVARQAEASAAMEKIGAASGSLSAKWSQVSDTVATQFMPVLSDVVTWIDTATDGLPESLEKGLTAMYKFNNQFAEGMKFLQEAPMHITELGKFWDERMKAADDRTAEQLAQGKKSAADQNAAATQSYKTQKEFERNVNLFGASVGAFTGAIDERQAMAAWAGNIGAAAGLKGLGQGAAGNARDSGGGDGNQFGGYGNPDRSVYTSDRGVEQFNFGNIRSSQGGFRKYDSPESGMMDQARLLRSYQSKHGLDSISAIINRWAPPSENKTSDYVKYMSKSMGLDKDSKIDLNDPKVLGQFQYYQSIMEKGADKIKGKYTIDDFQRAASKQITGIQQASYANNSASPSNFSTPALHAEGRDTVQMANLADAIASNLGIPRSQLMNKGARKSDISFAVRNEELMAANRLKAAQAQDAAPNLRPDQAAAAHTALRNAQREFDIIKTYGATLIGRGTGKETDERNLTLGRPDITVNLYVTGVDSPQSFGNKVVPVLSQGVKELQNSNANGVSH